MQKYRKTILSLALIGATSLIGPDIAKSESSNLTQHYDQSIVLLLDQKYRMTANAALYTFLETPLQINSGDKNEYLKQVLPHMPARVVAGEHVVSSLYCMAYNIYKEARSEPLIGQIAVALVTMNRVKNDYYPNTVCEVVYQKACNLENGVHQGCTAQFTWTWDGKGSQHAISLTDKSGRPVQSRVKAWKTAVAAASAVLSGTVKDFTFGALHYYNPYIANPRWAKVAHVKPVPTAPNGLIGNHRFVIDTNVVENAKRVEK